MSDAKKMVRAERKGKDHVKNGIRTDQIQVIQVLRAFAACAVVFIHADNRAALTLGLHWPVADFLAERLCNAGVDLFFVISGFLMMRLHRENFGVKGAATSFFQKRLLRIAPLYWLLTAFAIFILLVAPNLIGGGREVSVGWLLGNFLFVPWPQANGVMEHVIVVGWTLDYEVWFYVLFTLALLFRNGVGLLIGVLVACGVTGLFVHPVHPWPALLVSPMFFEFLAGIGIALGTYGRPMRRSVAWAILTLGLALLAGSTVVHGARYWKEGVPCALIMLGSVGLAPACKSLIGRFLTRVGDASYSIYLFQVFALPAAGVVFHILGASALPAWLAVLALWLSANAAGYLCWRYLEDPVTRALKKKLLRRTADHVDRTAGIISRLPLQH